MNIFKIVQHDDGQYSFNQEANGYWWHHDLRKYSSYEEAERAINKSWKDAVIDQNYVPRRMRPL